MDAFSQLLQATEGEFSAQLLQHPLAEVLRKGTVTLGHYVAYLRETYHLVRHTPRIFALAAARAGDGRTALRDWFLQQAQEESGHDLLCVKDLQRLGVPAEEILRGRPGPGAWGLITHDYYLASQGVVAALLGSASLSEQLGAFVAEPVMAALQASLRLPASALGFIRSHGQVDKTHFNETSRAVSTLVLPNELDDVIHSRQITIRHCARLLTDVLESTAAAGFDEDAMAAMKQTRATG